ncbi:conserved protein of unknown function (plasmid) [Rhodovastum atsumiense]|uniref:Uncharacterized protein n=1 Tax=Rhodovastum atsumiense TaxID=504468 RepID=A0A5M6IW43_9PROT|nr:hypothetical protein [Rhodovastum atsumiense]KAA5611625.1 hypothetical protein F1189_13780 [Rhodovastum atsumiense]CAH2606284.1 conserved protein of unknown function [Rhodovastum atsumiense]
MSASEVVSDPWIPAITPMGQSWVATVVSLAPPDPLTALEDQAASLGTGTRGDLFVRNNPDICPE